MSNLHTSEVARLREQIEQEYQAAERGLSGYASWPGTLLSSLVCTRSRSIANNSAPSSARKRLLAS